MTNNLIKLSAGALEMELNPSVGGSISAFRWKRDGANFPILHTRTTDDPSVLGMANFPLVPFVNRVRDGTFTFRGREVKLQANMKGDISPLHGTGWLAPWFVESASEQAAVLNYQHEAGEWPWAFFSRQVVQLDEGGFNYKLTCRNTSPDPMPCGLGIHPYFPCGSETRIDTQVSDVWTIDENVLPVEKIPATGRFALGERLICAQDLDHGFGGWGGRALISDPSWPFTTAFSSGDAKFFQLYSPPSGKLFAAEPVTHANAAMNQPEEEWAELGFRVLEPGEEMALNVRFDVTPV